MAARATPSELESAHAGPSASRPIRAVKADAGRVAIQRGPIVYCFEAVDNGGRVKDIVLARDPKFAAEHRPNLLGGVTVITGCAADGRKLTAVPYYAWDHREPGEMAVWVRQAAMPAESNVGNPADTEHLYRRFAPSK